MDISHAEKKKKKYICIIHIIARNYSTKIEDAIEIVDLLDKYVSPLHAYKQKCMRFINIQKINSQQPNNANLTPNKCLFSGT